MENNRINKLYNYLVEIGAETRSEEVFANDIYKPERREKLYNYLVNIGAETRPLEVFDNDLGFGQIKTPTSPSVDAPFQAPIGGSAYEAFKLNMIPQSVEQKPQVATVLPKYEAEPIEEEAPQTLEQMMGQLGGDINKLNKTIEGIENIPQSTMEAWDKMHPAEIGLTNNPISTGDEYIFQNIENGNIGQREYAFLKGQRENAIARMEAVLAKAKAMREANPDKYYTVVKMDTGHGLQEQLMPTNEGALLDTSIRMLEDNIKHYKNAVTKADKVNANKKNAFWKGMGEIDLVNIVSAGWANTLDALKASNIITKANNGGILTPEENLVLEMVKEQGTLDEILNSQGGLTSSYKAGQGVAESLPYIVGMATTSGLSGAIKEGIEKGVVTTATKSFRNFAQKAGSKLLGAGASAIATTPLQSGMWNNYANNTINEWKQYGELQDTAWGRLMDGAADAFTDVFTESLGGVLTKSAKYVLPDLGIKAAIAKKFGIHDAFIKEMLDKVQWGTVGEAGEEFLASFLAPIVRGESFKDMKEEWKDAFSKENIWVTLVTTGAMSAGFGSLRALEMGTQVAAYNNIKKNVANSLSKINDLELKQTVYDAMQLPTLKDTTEALAEINWRNYDKSDIGYAVEYVYNDLQKNVWNGVNLAEDANKAFSGAMVGIQAVARDGVIKTAEMNGEQVYLLGDILEGNEKTPIVVLHMDGRREQVPMSAVKEVGITPVDDVVAELYANTVAEAQQAKAVDQVAEETQIAKAAGVTPVQEQEESGFEEGQIVSVNGEEGEITAIDPYTRKARVQVGGRNISVSFDEIQRSVMDEELQMDEQTAEVEGAEVTPTTEQEESIEEAPVEHSSEQETPTPLQMPMTEQGEPNFEVAGTDLSAQYLTEQLEPERIDGFVQVNIDSAQKALEKAEKKQPKSTVFSEYKNKIAQIAEEKKQAQDRLAFWQDVKGKLTAIQTAPSVEAVAEETAPTETMVEETTPVAEEVTPENVEATPEVAEQEIAPTEPIVAEEVSVEETTPTVEATEEIEVEDIPEVEATTEEAPKRLSEDEAGLYGEGWEKRADAKVFEALAKALGVRIELVDDIDNGLGNGKYFGNTILVRKKDKSKGLKFVAGHEILHRMSTLSPEAFEEFKGVVKETMGKEFDQKANRLKQQYTSLYKKGKVAGVPTNAVIEEEVVADFVGDLADDRESDALVQFVERNQEKRTMLQTLRNALQHILNLFGKNSNRRTAKNIAKNIKAMDALMKLYDASVQNAASGNVATSEADTRNSLREENDINIDIIEGENGDIEAITDTEKGQGLFSLRTYNEGGRDALAGFLAQRMADGALTTAEAQEMVKQMDDIYRICNEMKDSYAPFGAWSDAKVVVDEDGDPVFSVIKQNGEYVMNLDFSLVCKKRRTLDAVLNEMVKRGMIEEIPSDNTTIAKINNVIRNYGFETACALCFVDARRFQVLNTAKQFTDLWNTIVRSAVPIGTELGYFDFANGGVSEGVAVELNTEALTKMSEGKTVAARIAKHILANPQDARLLRPRDFVSTAGFDNVKAQNPAIMKLYNSKKGTGGPKAAFSDVQYLNDILNTNWKEEDAFAIGGVRLQSFSDYVPRMVFDYIQMIADLAAKGLPVHAYTKEMLFAKTFGLTGMKINLSLVPDVVEGGVAAGLDAEGNYVWKEGETFPYEEAIAIQNAEGYKENCGTIAVGVSDAHILKMLDDDNIRMVIPYHKSGLPKAVAKMNNVAGFTDYTNVGKEKHKSGKALTKEEAKEIPNFNELLREYNDPRKAAQAFLDWCESKGYTPRFAKFASHPNYYKLLEDFTTLVEGEYVPQEAVKFNFPTEGNAFGSLASLIEQGLEEDAVLEGQRDEKVGAIVEEVGEVLGTTRYSIREMDAPYLEAVEKGDMETAQRMVEEAANIAGYSTDDSWRMAHRAPVRDEENANPFNTEIIVPEDYWTHPEWYSNMRNSTNRESYYNMKSAIDKYKKLVAEGKQEEADKVSVTMYRGVDKTANKRESKFRNGDWITPSREYALLSAPYGKARVIEQDVLLKDIWWDGNSINEWGYDDGSNYTYRDTKNNRKLLDAVTYDDNGNVIPLSERFNPRNEDIRYSLIGEEGARNLDIAEEATIRLDNLNVAREMESAGKDAKTIKMATGWERGADYFWRYEIDDVKIVNPEEWVNKKGKLTLGDIVTNAEELFTAYPKLKDIKIKKSAAKGNAGSHNSQDNTITISVGTIRRGLEIQNDIERFNTTKEQIDSLMDQVINTDLRGTLVHEIQHAIQNIEGFARGGNAKMVDPTLNKAKVLAYEQEMVDQINEKVRQYNSLSTMERRTPQGSQLRAQIHEAKKKFTKFQKEITLGNEGYRKLAGEVEARNIEKRLGLTPEERRATLAEATEDVARDDQIFILYGMEKAEKMKGTADRNASEFRQPTSTKRSPSLSRFGAKLRKDYESAIDEVEKLIGLKGRLSSHEFLKELDNAVSEDPKIERNISDYVHIGDGFTLRISDHYSNAKSFADNDNKRDNFGIVVRPELDRAKSVFSKFPNVDYVEYVYFPDKLDVSRQLDMLEGIKNFIKTKDFANLPAPDNTHTSGKPLFSIRDYADNFKALQEEYSALDKNDPEAVAIFRANKRNLVERSWDAMADELGLPCEFIVVDSTINREALLPIYNVIKPIYEAKINKPLTFDQFADEWENDVNYAAAYVDGANIIVGDVVKFDDYNSQDVMTQLFIHENIHHFIDNYITPRELKRLWREVALTPLGRRVVKTYPDADAAKLADEYLAYLIAGVNETDVEPLLDFIKSEGNVSLNDLLSSYGKILPLRGGYATIILKTLRNGYEEREELRNEEGEEVGENNEPARRVEADNDSRGWLEEDLREGQEDVTIVEFDETPLYSLRTSPEQRLIDENNIITRRLENAQEVALAKRKNQKEQGSVRTIEKGIFNRLADVEKMQETLFEMGVEKSDANNFIARFEAVRNVVDYRNRKEQEKVIVPMLNIVSAINEKYGFIYADISDYLAAKHSIEREDVSSIQTMSTDADAVWNRAECERIVAEFEGKVSKEEVDELWNCVRAITQNTLSILQAGGVYTKEQIKEIQSNGWQFYVPLQGWDIEAEGLVDPSLLYEVAGRGTSSNGKWQEHSAEGRKTKPQDPLSTIAFKMYKAIYVAEYNKAMNSLYYLVSDAVTTLGRDKTDFLFKASEMLYRKTETGYDEVDIETITQEELDFNNELEAKIKKLRKERREKLALQSNVEDAIEHKRKEELKPIGLNEKTLRKKANSPEEESSLYRQFEDINEKYDKQISDSREAFAKEYKAIKNEIAELEAQRTIFTRSTDTNIPNEVIVSEHIDQARRVYFYVNGRRMYVQFANPKYSQAINGKIIVKRTKIAELAAKYTRFLSQSFTTFNPEFSFVTNPIRDFRDAVLTHLMDAENGNIGGFINNYVFHWGRSQGAIYRAQRGTNNPLTAEELAKFNILNRADRKVAIREYGKERVEDTLFMWFAENGGITGYTQSNNIYTLGEKLKKDVTKMQNGDFSVHASAYRALADSAEIITRYATFLASLDKGQSVGQAVSNGRNVSVNFNRKGESSDTLGIYYSFFNASMQGIYKFFRLAKKYPARFGAVVVAQMALGYATSRLVDMLVSTLLPDNDDDELTTIDIPLWMRLGYTCIPVRRKDGKMHVIRIPKSIVGASFSAVGVLLNELENGRVTRGEALSALGGQIASSWTYGFSEGAPIFRAAIPTGAQVAFDIFANMDAFGREIYRTDKFNRQIPASELGNKNVIPFIYEATKALNAATGGNEYKSGAVDINPSVVQYILQSVSGGYGVLARKLAEFISPAFSDQVEFEAQNLPMLGRLAYTVEPKSWYNDYAEYEEKYGSARLSNAKKEFSRGYITEDELEDIQKHNVIVKSQDKYINKLLDLRKQFDINTPGYNALSDEINRQRGLMVKLMEEIDWSKDNIAAEARRVATKYDPNYKENLLKIRTEYAKEN